MNINVVVKFWVASLYKFISYNRTISTSVIIHWVV